MQDDTAAVEEIVGEVVEAWKTRYGFQTPPIEYWLRIKDSWGILHTKKVNEATWIAAKKQLDYIQTIHGVSIYK